jgi:hypothetical protein
VLNDPAEPVLFEPLLEFDPVVVPPGGGVVLELHATASETAIADAVANRKT